MFVTRSAGNAREGTWVTHDLTLLRKTAKRYAQEEVDAAPAELNLKRQVSDICHRTGVPGWEALVKTIFDWFARLNEAQRFQGWAMLVRILEELKIHAERYEQAQAKGVTKEFDEARARIHQTLQDFADGMRITGRKQGLSAKEEKDTN